MIPTRPWKRKAARNRYYVLIPPPLRGRGTYHRSYAWGEPGIGGYPASGQRAIPVYAGHFLLSLEGLSSRPSQYLPPADTVPTACYTRPLSKAWYIRYQAPGQSVMPMYSGHFLPLTRDTHSDHQCLPTTGTFCTAGRYPTVHRLPSIESIPTPFPRVLPSTCAKVVCQPAWW